MTVWVEVDVYMLGIEEGLTVSLTCLNSHIPSPRTETGGVAPNSRFRVRGFNVFPTAHFELMMLMVGWADGASGSGTGQLV